jgi:hypothetical protein
MNTIKLEVKKWYVYVLLISGFVGFFLQFLLSSTIIYDIFYNFGMGTMFTLGWLLLFWGVKNE